MSDLSRRFLLRNATRTAHETLDAQVGGFETVEEYKRYLAGTALFRRSIEPALAKAQMPASLAGWQPTLIEAEVNRDLEQMNIEPETPFAMEPATSESAVFGILYVLEGSGMGARLLTRRAAALGLSEENGAAHLFAQARNIQAWQAFVLALENTEAFDEDAAVAAANDTFECAQRAFAHASKATA